VTAQIQYILIGFRQYCLANIYKLAESLADVYSSSIFNNLEKNVFTVLLCSTMPRKKNKLKVRLGWQDEKMPNKCVKGNVTHKKTNELLQKQECD
jgi:hypothetical protein